MTLPPVSASTRTLDKSDAFHNHKQYKKYQTELTNSKNPWIGVYKGHQFVVITENDGIFSKLHFLLRRLFRMISVDQEKIEDLHTLSEERYRELTPKGQIEHFKNKYLKHKSRSTAALEKLTVTETSLKQANENASRFEAGLKKAQEKIASWETNFQDKITAVSKQKKEEAQEAVSLLQLKLEATEKRAEEQVKKAEVRILELESEIKTMVANTESTIHAHVEKAELSFKEKRDALKRELTALKEKLSEPLVAPSTTTMPENLRIQKYKHKIAGLEERIKVLENQISILKSHVAETDAIDETAKEHHHHIHKPHSHKKKKEHTVEESNPTEEQTTSEVTIESSSTTTPDENIQEQESAELATDNIEEAVAPSTDAEQNDNETVASAEALSAEPSPVDPVSEEEPVSNPTDANATAETVDAPAAAVEDTAPEEEHHHHHLPHPHLPHPHHHESKEQKHPEKSNDGVLGLSGH